MNAEIMETSWSQFSEDFDHMGIMIHISQTLQSLIYLCNLPLSYTSWDWTQITVEVGHCWYQFLSHLFHDFHASSCCSVATLVIVVTSCLSPAYATYLTAVFNLKLMETPERWLNHFTVTHHNHTRCCSTLQSPTSVVICSLKTRAEKLTLPNTCCTACFRKPKNHIQVTKNIV